MFNRKRTLTKFGTQSGVLSQQNLKYVALAREALVEAGATMKRPL